MTTRRRIYDTRCDEALQGIRPFCPEVEQELGIGQGPLSKWKR